MTAPTLVSLLQRQFVWATLVSVCLTPSFGSFTLVITFMAMLVALPVAVMRRGWAEAGAKRWVWGACLLYCFYFVTSDALLNGDILFSLYTMAPNLPLIAAALIAMALDPARATLAPARIGYWAGIAVLASFVMALLIWTIQPSWQFFGFNLTNITGVNGRLALLVGNALPFAATYMTLGFLALLGWHERKPLSRGLALGALLVALGTVVFWSQSRGATLTAVPLLFLAIRFLRPSPKQLYAAFFALAVFVGVAITLGNFDEQIVAVMKRLVNGLSTFFTGDQSKEVSTGQRLLMYQAGLNAWLDSPIWGYGISQRFVAAAAYLSDATEIRYSHLHNTFLTHAVAGGIVGVIILLALILIPLAINYSASPALVSATDDMRYSAWMIVISLLGIGMTNMILNQDVSAHFLALLMLMHLAMYYDAQFLAARSRESNLVDF